MTSINEIIIDDDVTSVPEDITILSNPGDDMTIDPLTSTSTNDSIQSLDSSINSINTTIQDITIDDEDDDIEVVQELPTGRRTRSGRMFVESAVKCSNCRQASPKTFVPEDGVGINEVVVDKTVNILLELDPEDDEGLPLQYKITDFSIYCKSDGNVNHLVPVFADNLLSNGKKIFMSGKLLRLDQDDEDGEGLRVKDIGPITMWSNAAGMDVGHENIIISAEHNKQDLEFNLMKPCSAYRDTFLEIFFRCLAYDSF